MTQAKSVPVGFIYNSKKEDQQDPKYKGHSTPGKARVKKLVVADEPPAFREAVMEYNVLDLDLYRAANLALDSHIRKIGKVRFERALETYNTLQKQADDACGTSEAANMTVGGGYNPRQDCYWEDNGCAIKCLDIFYRANFNTTGADLGMH